MHFEWAALHRHQWMPFLACHCAAEEEAHHLMVFRSVLLESASVRSKHRSVIFEYVPRGRVLTNSHGEMKKCKVLNNLGTW